MSTHLRRKLRANSTISERAFWRLIHPLRTDGYHFRKQVELGTYYVDFACLHAGLMVEIDGDTHGQAPVRVNDETRDEYLQGRGFQVLRFANADVLNNPEGVYHVVCQALDGRASNRRAGPPPQPSPRGGGCPAGEVGTIEHQARSHTLPLAGRAGEGGP